MKKFLITLTLLTPLAAFAFDDMGLKVPEVLTSGDHGKVDKWREQKSREITLKNRPDLLKGE